VAFRFTTRHQKAFLGALVSVLALVWLGTSVGFSGLVSALSGPMAYGYLCPLVILTLLIPILYGLRWKQLLGGRLDRKNSIVSAIVGLGGNMFLPARGGDLLRLHHSHSVGHVPVAELFSRFLVEKVLDLSSMAAIGLIAVLLLGQNGETISSSGLALGTAIALMVIVLGIYVLKYWQGWLLGLLRPLFSFRHKEAKFERHIVRLITDASQCFTLRTLMLPTGLTLILWVAVYAGAYLMGGRFVGVNLSYPEALLVVCAGALGLMLPAAPSGVGTYHASVASVFLILGRPVADGLLLATVLHLFFFVTLGVPAILLHAYWHWRNVRVSP